MKLPLLLLTGITAAAAAAPANLVPRQVKDINAYPEARVSAPRLITQAGKLAFFKAWDPIHGEELWKSDGTEDGTVVVRDIAPGAGDAGIGWIVAAGDRVLFSVSDPVEGSAFWVSDGTELGTRELVKFAGGLTPEQMLEAPVSVRGIVYLRIPVQGMGTALFAWNGERETAVELNPPRGITRPFTPNGRIVSDGTYAVFPSGIELWRSNGTTGGTQRLGVVTQGANSFEVLGGSGEMLYLMVQKGFQKNELWKYPANTKTCTLITGPDQGGPSVSAKRAAFHGNRIYFAASDKATGEELWMSDGTAETTRRLTDLRAGAPGSLPDGLLVLSAGRVVGFTAEDRPGNRQVWTFLSNGAPSQPGPVSMVTRLGLTEHLEEFLPGVGGFAFTTVEEEKGRTLWRTGDDGRNPARMGLISSVPPGDPAGIAVVNSRLFFAGSRDGQFEGEELWTSNGTPGGTRLLKDLTPGTGGSNVVPQAAVGNTLYFRAEDGEHGTEVWKTDGTADGTAMVQDLRPGPESSTPSRMTAHGKSLYFTANVPDANRESLWRLDPGKPMSMVMAPEDDGEYPALVTQMTPLRKRLLFSVYGGEDEGIWLAARGGRGPVLAKGKPARPIRALGFTEMGKYIYFSAETPAHGRELWRVERSKGTLTLVADLAPGPESSEPGEFAVLGRTLFFTARDVGGQMNLWRCDGTAKGTQRVTAPSRWAAGGSGPELTVAGRKRIFFMADDGSHGRELWTSDGTALGTRMVKDIHPGGGQETGKLVIAGDVVFFSADDGMNGREPWRSDGTEAGTYMLSDLQAGREGSKPYYLVPVGKRVFFAAFGDGVGDELFMSDGTRAGTKLVADLVPGPGSSAPLDLLQVGKKLYFSAATTDSGRELWVIDQAETGR